MNPLVINQVLRNDDVLRQEVDNVTAVPPWLWNLGPRRYIVYAFLIERV
jgi:hypothetical protein